MSTEGLQVSARSALDAALMPEIIQLKFDHPANDDREYQRRRGVITEVSLRYREGEPVPRVEYTDAEDEVWRAVRRRTDEAGAVESARGASARGESAAGTSERSADASSEQPRPGSESVSRRVARRRARMGAECLTGAGRDETGD
jgi:hypothetical protein